ncbi:hypothetical protein AVM02_02275 [Brucella anthropi]
MELRLVAKSDAFALQQLMTSEISRWLATWPYPLSQTVTEQIIGRALEQYYHQRALPLVIIDHSDGQIIGWIKVFFEERDSQKFGEIGYWLSENAQGNGFAYEASSALIKVCFEQIGVALIQAGAQTTNHVSLNLLKKLGMQNIGERLVYAPARDREELCTYFEIKRMGV